MPDAVPTLTPDRLIFDLRSASSPIISHNGEHIAYVLGGIERGSAKPVSHLWLMNADGGNPRQLTQTGSSTSDPAWSPDDRSIAFVSKRGDGFAICVLPLDGGEARTVTTHAQKPASLEWSPGGARIAYTVPIDPENPDEVERDKDAPPAVRVIRRIDYKQDNRGYLLDVRHQVMSVDVASGDRRQISRDLQDHNFPQWSPDGTRIAAKVSNRNGMHSMLALFPLEGGETTTIGWEDGSIGTWAWSPDGASILLSGFERSSPQPELYRYDLANGEMTHLTTDLDFVPEAGYPTVSSPAAPIFLDGATALIAGGKRGGTGLWTIDIADGALKEIAVWDATHTGLSVDGSGSVAVQGRSDLTGACKVVSVDVTTGAVTTLLDPNEELLAETPPAQAERITVERDGWQIDAWVYKPADFDASKQYPLVMDVHGGPHGVHGFTWLLGAQALAGAGFIVVAPNPRGSSTYGREFAEAVIGDWGGEDWQDLLAVVDHLAAEPYVDATRIGVYGYSYGGLMTSWALGQTDRFGAIVCGAPVFNLKSFWGTSDIGHVFGENQFGGSPLDPKVAQFMEDRSPSTHIHKATTPTLIVHGEDDHRCPIGQGEEMFVSLVKAGVDVEFVRYPGGSHLMLRGGPVQHRLDFYTRVLTWFQKHLQPSA